MKRFTLAAGLTLAVVVPGVASAKLSHSDAVAYKQAYAQVSHKLGIRSAGCKLIGPKRTCHYKATVSKIRASTDVLNRMLAPPPAPTPVQSSSSSSNSTTTSYSGSSSGGYSNIPGVPSSFAACVATRESSNGAGSSNIYGILGGGGSGSIAEQKAAFAQLYAQYGTAPWQPYDGCTL